ncbi:MULTISPECIES: hypothetical protein [unclassified Curtobacterium]|uniref:hypothetical protein n=1 Tax=unclassified Curtobacterium TaxID=257496 RepID=UPI0011B614A6|nr:MULTISPECIES: hypothetical protein [unclassified Curtobacterium]
MFDVHELLQRHDAEPARPLTPQEADRADALLRAISATPPDWATTRPAPSKRRTHRARPWMLAGALTVAAAVGGVSLIGTGPLAHLVHVIGGSANSATLTTAQVSSWTPIASTPPATTDVHDLAVQCLRGYAEHELTPREAAVVTVTNVEQRGEVTSLISSGGAGAPRVWCLAGPNGIATSERIDDAASPLKTLRPQSLNLQTFGGQGDDDNATMSGYGQAGSDVTSLTIEMPGHPAVTTSVDDGLWSMWWPSPGLRTLPDLGAITLTWTTKDGTQHTGTAQDLTWDRVR